MPAPAAGMTASQDGQKGPIALIKTQPQAAFARPAVYEVVMDSAFPLAAVLRLSAKNRNGDKARQFYNFMIMYLTCSTKGS
jgi:hypothetical protein